MKNFCLLALVLFQCAISSCNKEEDIVPYIAMRGDFTNTPNPNAGFWEVPIPDGSTFITPKQYVVDGSSVLFGNVDETASKLLMSNVGYDPAFAVIMADVEISLIDYEGDELRFLGVVYSFLDFSNSGYFHVSGGTGKWDNAAGWINSKGQMNPKSGINTLTAEGQITKPKL